MDDDDPAPMLVLLVEDHDLTRKALCALLNSQPDIDVVADSAPRSSRTVADAIDLVTELAPEVAILDLRLPDGTGLDLCRRIRSISPSTTGIIHTGLELEPAVAREAGAAAIALKQLSDSQLQTILRRHRPSRTKLRDRSTAGPLGACGGGERRTPSSGGQDGSAVEKYQSVVS